MVADGLGSSVLDAKTCVTEPGGRILGTVAAASAIRRGIAAGALATFVAFATTASFAQSRDVPARSWWSRPAAVPAPSTEPSSREVLLGTITTGKSESDDRPGIADRILADGLDALHRGDVMLGRRRLEAVIDAYPESAAAATASRELSVLYNIRGRSAPTRSGETTARWVPTQDRPEPDNASDPVRSVGDVASDAGDSSKSSKDAEAKEALARERQSRRDERWLKALSFKFQMEVGDRVFFAENSADIGARSRSVLAAQARWLINHPGVPVVIEGHADDNGGNRDFDVQMSEQRARAVQERLVEQGLDPSRIAVVAFGRDRPVATCLAPECAAQNRRAITRVGGSPEVDLERRGAGTPNVAVAPARSPPASRD